MTRRPPRSTRTDTLLPSTTLSRSAYKPAQPSFLTKPSVHRLAESIAHQVGWAPGGDIHKTIQNLGGRVETEDTLLTDPDQTGSLFVDGADKFKIIVPAHTSPERDRFTIAHEFEIGRAHV